MRWGQITDMVDEEHQTPYIVIRLPDRKTDYGTGEYDEHEIQGFNEYIYKYYVE